MVKNERQKVHSSTSFSSYFCLIIITIFPTDVLIELLYTTGSDVQHEKKLQQCIILKHANYYQNSSFLASAAL